MILALLALGSAPAAAADVVRCEELDESAFIELLLQGEAAVDDGDAETQHTRVSALTERVPCLSFAVRPRLLSELFVLQALDAFATQGDWTTPLDAALRLRPGIDRGVGGAHPMARHPEPAPFTAPGTPLAPGRVVYVDGLRAVELPGDPGLHLVQATEDGLWRSVLIDGAHPLPAGWLEEPFQAPREWRWWGNTSVALGPGGTHQRRAAAWAFGEGQEPWAPDTAWTAVWPVIAGRGAVVNGRIGVAAEVELGFEGFARPVGDHAQAAIVYGQKLMFGGGLGLAGNTRSEADVTQGPPAVRKLSEGLPYAYATTVFADDVWDAALTFGGGPSTTRASMVVGLGGTERGAFPARFGLSSSVGQGRYVEEGTGGADAHTLDAWSWRVGLEVGVRKVP